MKLDVNINIHKIDIIIRTFKYYLECKLVRSAAWQQEGIHIDKPCAMSIQWHECCHHVRKNGKIEWRIAPSPRRGRKLLPMSHRQCFAPHPEQSQKTRLHPFGLSHERPTLVYWGLYDYMILWLMTVAENATAPVWAVPHAANLDLLRDMSTTYHNPFLKSNPAGNCSDDLLLHKHIRQQAKTSNAICFLDL